MSIKARTSGNNCFTIRWAPTCRTSLRVKMFALRPIPLSLNFSWAPTIKMVSLRWSRLLWMTSFCHLRIILYPIYQPSKTYLSLRDLRFWICLWRGWRSTTNSIFWTRSSYRIDTSFCWPYFILSAERISSCIVTTSKILASSPRLTIRRFLSPIAKLRTSWACAWEQYRISLKTRSRSRHCAFISSWHLDFLFVRALRVSLSFSEEGPYLSSSHIS